jgi:hypothetical protein
LYSLLVARIGELSKAMFAGEIAAHQAAQDTRIAAEAAEKKAARDHEAAMAKAENDAAAIASETAAAQFVPIKVERLNGQDVRILGEDNHVAMAYRQDGETVVYRIDDIDIKTMLANAEALNRRIHAMVPKR